MLSVYLGGPPLLGSGFNRFELRDQAVKQENVHIFDDAFIIGGGDICLVVLVMLHRRA